MGSLVSSPQSREHAMRTKHKHSPGLPSTRNNPRLINTPRQVPGLPPLIKPSPSRRRFALTKAFKLLIYYVAAERVAPRVFPGLFMPMQLSEFDAPQEVYIRRLLLSPGDPTSGGLPPVTLRETALRGVTAVWWAWGSFVLLDGFHALLSLLAVAVLRVDEPADWPPLFGDLREAYTVRRFWGKVWHKLLLRPYVGAGLWASARAPLGRGSAVSKLLVAFIVFFLSGCAHAAAAWQLDDCGTWTLDIGWFLANFAVVTFEVGASGVLRWVAVRSGYGRGWANLGARYPLAARVLGYVWVFAFLFWSVPKWQYPKVRCAIMREVERAQGAM